MSFIPSVNTFIPNDKSEFPARFCQFQCRALRSFSEAVRVGGIEPPFFDWQPNVLPLNHTRVKYCTDT